MKTTTRTFVAIALMVACCTTSNAQFGKLLNKAKNSVKEKVKNEVENKVDETKSKVTKKAKAAAGIETSSNSNEQSGFNPNKTYTLSKEALAADPQANDTTVEKGFTKSIGQIHACFEQLADYSLYKPYYTADARRFYGIGQNTSANAYRQLFSYFWNSQKVMRPVYEMNEYAPVSLSNMQIVVPADELVANWWTLRFVADPKSETALKEFMYVYTLFENLVLKASYTYCMKDEFSGTVSDNSILASDYKDMKWKRTALGYDMVMTYTPMENLLKLANELADGISAANATSFSRLLNHHVLTTLINEVIANRDDRPSDDQMRLLKLKIESPTVSELTHAFQSDSGTPVAEPKGVTVDAKTRTEGTKAAKEYAGNEFEKVIFLTSSWTTQKESKYPYRVMGYSMKIAIVTKSGGKRYLQNCLLGKKPDGKTYFVQAGLGDAQKHPIK